MDLPGDLNLPYNQTSTSCQIISSDSYLMLFTGHPNNLICQQSFLLWSLSGEFRNLTMWTVLFPLFKLSLTWSSPPLCQHPLPTQSGDAGLQAKDSRCFLESHAFFLNPFQLNSTCSLRLDIIHVAHRDDRSGRVPLRRSASTPVRLAEDLYLIPVRQTVYV